MGGKTQKQEMKLKFKQLSLLTLEFYLTMPAQSVARVFNSVHVVGDCIYFQNHAKSHGGYFINVPLTRKVLIC